MKKLTAFLAAVLLASGCFGATALAKEDSATVKFRIEGIEGCFCDREFKTDSATLDGFFREADEASEDFELTITESEYGAYISAVNGEAAGTFGGYDGWLFTVNGADPGVGMSSVEIKDGDSVLLYYADPFGAGFQFPEADLEKIGEGIISFVSRDTVYDENYNPSVSVNPVAGMSVKWYTGENEYKEYKTDENGVISVDKALLTGGAHKVEYYKYNADGLPLALRSAANYTVTVENDVSAGARDGAAVIGSICTAALALAVTAACKCAGKKDKEKYAE